jgi:2-polyprenyl-3-methyl-5-hydroxy-6-metoxy-1,4-benzoquinol methylase
LNNWQKAQLWETAWHDSVATNSFYEEMKQFEYARKMGIEIYTTPETPYNIRNYGSVLDIGGGDCSLLLKVEGKLTGSTVIDPCEYAEWAKLRYTHKGIDFINEKAEDMELIGYDECWIYNCLQHTEDPEKICKNAKKASNLIRIFEWVDMPVSEGHLHTLTKEKLDEWLGCYGKVERMNSNGCHGLAYFAILPC